MVVAIAQLDLAFPGAQSLKDKRSLLQSRMVRIGRASNIGITQVADKNLVGNALVAMVALGVQQPELEKQMRRAIQLFESCPEIEVRHMGLDFKREGEWF